MFCGSICRLTHIIFLLNTDVKGTPSQIERLGATDSVARPVTLLTLLTQPLSFSSLKTHRLRWYSPAPSANRVARPVTLLTLQTLRTRETGRGSQLQSIANKAGDLRGLTGNTRDTADTADSANPCSAATPRIIGADYAHDTADTANLSSRCRWRVGFLALPALRAAQILPSSKGAL